jgi:hypothetical protein
MCGGRDDHVRLGGAVLRLLVAANGRDRKRGVRHSTVRGFGTVIVEDAFC